MSSSSAPVGGSDIPSGPTKPGSTNINVTGKALDNWKRPLIGMPVVVSGKAPVVTDGNGNFSVSDVTPPYDVSLVYSPSRIATIYKGMMRADPVLWGSADGPTPQTANLSGSLSGGTFPQPAGHATRVAVVAPENGYYDDYANTAGAYSFSPFQWYGSTSTTATIHALQLRYSGTALVEYKGYGKRDNVPLSSGGTFSGQNIQLTAIANGNVSGTVSVPSGYTLSTKRLDLRLSPGRALELSTDSSTTPTFSFLTPNIGPTALMLYIQAVKTGTARYSESRRALPATASGIALNVPAGPEQNLPADGATDVNKSTNFSWSGFAGGVHFLQIYSQTVGRPTYFVFTAGASTTIPDLTSVGLGLPPSSPYKWQVFGFGPFSSVDEIAVQAGPFGLYRSLPGDSSAGNSGERGFSTGP